MLFHVFPTNNVIANKNIFKVFLLDVGLLGAMSRLAPKILLEEILYLQNLKVRSQKIKQKSLRIYQQKYQPKFVSELICLI